MPPKGLFFLCLVLCLALLAGPAAGQQGGSGAGLYNPRTVETVQGLVVSGPAPPSAEGLPEPVHLTLQTAGGKKITVILGPRFYVEKQGVKIAVLDRIEVTGSLIQLQGKPALIAAEVRKGSQVLKLREPDGLPLWGRQGRK